jgi:hypothetical protein
MSNTYYDPCSFSNPDFFLIEHVHIDWSIDFDRKVFDGCVELILHKMAGEACKESDNLVLDTRDLKIDQVVEVNSGEKLGFEMGNFHKDFGTPLKIQLGHLANST